MVQANYIRTLSSVLAAAFAPEWLPAHLRQALRFIFILVLIAARRRGVIAYVPGRAAVVLTPPRRRPWLFTNQLAQLGRTHWCISSCGAWPTGKGAGTLLLGRVCELADAAGNDLCLRSSNEKNQHFYQGLGFKPTGCGVLGRPMARQSAPVERRSCSDASPVYLEGRRVSQYIKL